MNLDKEDDFAREMMFSFDSVMNAPDAFVAIDYNLNFLFINKLAEKFYKKGSAELLGKNLKAVYPTEMEFWPFRNVLKNVQDRKSFTVSYQSPFVKEWVQLSGRPFENYYTFTYRVIDYQQSLKDELRSEMKRRK